MLTSIGLWVGKEYDIQCVRCIEEVDHMHPLGEIEAQLPCIFLLDQMHVILDPHPAKHLCMFVQ